MNFIIVKNMCVIGDFDQFTNKYNTYAKTHPYGDQFLSSKFYMNEHTKPLFNANKIWFRIKVRQWSVARQDCSTTN